MQHIPGKGAIPTRYKQIKVRGAGVYVLQTHVSPVGGDIAQAELVDPVANPGRT